MSDFVEVLGAILSAAIGAYVLIFLANQLPGMSSGILYLGAFLLVVAAALGILKTFR